MDSTIHLTSFNPEAKLKKTNFIWQVFWLTFLFEAFPSLLFQTVAACFKKFSDYYRSKGLQLRVQLRNFLFCINSFRSTGFPINPNW